MSLEGNFSVFLVFITAPTFSSQDFQREKNQVGSFLTRKRFIFGTLWISSEQCRVGRFFLFGDFLGKMFGKMAIFSSKWGQIWPRATHFVQMLSSPCEVILWWFMSIKSPSLITIDSGTRSINGNQSWSIYRIDFFLSCSTFIQYFQNRRLETDWYQFLSSPTPHRLSLLVLIHTSSLPFTHAFTLLIVWTGTTIWSESLMICCPSIERALWSGCNHSKFSPSSNTVQHNWVVIWRSLFYSE